MKVKAFPRPFHFLKLEPANVVRFQEVFEDPVFRERVGLVEDEGEGRGGDRVECREVVIGRALQRQAVFSYAVRRAVALREQKRCWGI